jgi:hypothetical protein
MCVLRGIFLEFLAKHHPSLNPGASVGVAYSNSATSSAGGFFKACLSIVDHLWNENAGHQD